LHQIALQSKGFSSIFRGLNDASFVVSGFGYRRFLDDLFPFLELFGFDGSSLVFLLGFHFFVFSGRFCRWCGAPISSGAFLGLCDSCLSSPRGVSYRVIVSGCDGSVVPPYRYVVYLGSFGDVVKVGVSRLDRNGSSNGFLFRLLEQGVEHFAVFDGGWNVCVAQSVEVKLVEEFGFVDRVSFLDKLDLFYEDGLSLGEFSSIVSEVHDFLGSGVSLVSQGMLSWPRLSAFDFVWHGSFVSGEIVGFRGNLVLFDDGSSRFAVDLSSLVGSGVVCWEV